MISGILAFTRGARAEALMSRVLSAVSSERWSRRIKRILSEAIRRGGRRPNKTRGAAEGRPHSKNFYYDFKRARRGRRRVIYLLQYIIVTERRDATGGGRSRPLCCAASHIKGWGTRGWRNPLHFRNKKSFTSLLAASRQRDYY